MRKKEKRYEEDRWMKTMRRTASERRQSIILHRELLKFDRRDRRSGADRRRGIGERTKPAYILE